MHILLHGQDLLQLLLFVEMFASHPLQLVALGLQRLIHFADTRTEFDLRMRCLVLYPTNTFGTLGKSRFQRLHPGAGHIHLLL